ncbi:MAG: hypothetical protein KUG78_05240 [Kangiellaceae bacterium]|nr:hypothetical protein [Kangiellaceae bacterium]
MRYLTTLIFGCILITLALPIISVPEPLENFSKETQYKSIKLSPDGKHYAAEVPYGDQTMLVVINRASMKSIHAFRFLKDEHMDQYYWANNYRLVFTRYIRREYREAPTTMGQIFAGNIDGSWKSIIFGGKNTKGTRLNRSQGSERAWGRILHLLPDDPEHIVLEARSFEQKVDSPVRLLKLNINNSKKRLISKTPFGLMDIVLTKQGLPFIESGRDARGV